jgi:hypothetical protein
MPAQGERLVADAPVGIDHVLVNGVPIRANGVPVQGDLERLPGTILTNGPAAATARGGRPGGHSDG